MQFCTPEHCNLHTKATTIIKKAFQIRIWDYEMLLNAIKWPTTPLLLNAIKWISGFQVVDFMGWMGSIKWVKWNQQSYLMNYVH